MGPTTRWARGVLPVFPKVGMAQLLVRVLEAQQWWYDKVLRRWPIGCQFRPCGNRSRKRAIACPPFGVQRAPTWKGANVNLPERMQDERDLPVDYLNDHCHLRTGRPGTF